MTGNFDGAQLVKALNAAGFHVKVKPSSGLLDPSGRPPRHNAFVKTSRHRENGHYSATACRSGTELPLSESSSPIGCS